MNLHRVLLPAMLLLICGMAMAAPVTKKAAPEHCILAAIWRDGGVTVDWACVDVTAARWKPGAARNSTAAWAYALKAVHDGNANAK